MKRLFEYRSGVSYRDPKGDTTLRNLPVFYDPLPSSMSCEPLKSTEPYSNFLVGSYLYEGRSKIQADKFGRRFTKSMIAPIEAHRHMGCHPWVLALKREI